MPTTYFYEKIKDFLTPVFLLNMLKVKNWPRLQSHGSLGGLLKSISEKSRVKTYKQYLSSRPDDELNAYKRYRNKLICQKTIL